MIHEYVAATSRRELHPTGVSGGWDVGFVEFTAMRRGWARLREGLPDTP